jgi:hypothetical protein
MAGTPVEQKCTNQLVVMHQGNPAGLRGTVALSGIQRRTNRTIISMTLSRRATMDADESKSC